MHSDQWRYEKGFPDAPPASGPFSRQHVMDIQAAAVRMGWLPFYPQFNRNPIHLVEEAKQAGASNANEIRDWTVEQLRTGRVRFAVEDPDSPENWPRVWLIWRANALHASAKGHEFFLRHYLGTHDNAIAEEVAEGSVEDVVWRDGALQGKMDLIVDLNFRMDTSAMYSDVILPAASWYEKNDLNTTAGNRCGECRSDSGFGFQARPKGTAPGRASPHGSSYRHLHSPSRPEQGQRVGFETGGVAKAYPIAALETIRVVNDRVGGAPVVVIHQPPSDTTTAYIAAANGRTLRFRATNAAASRLTDLETRSTWSAYGECLSGKLKGRHLKRLILEPEFWFVWSEFHPKTELYVPTKAHKF